MSLHEHVTQLMEQFVTENDACVSLMPSALASHAYQQWKGKRKIEPHIEWGCLEHFKGLARRVLSKRYEPDGEANEAYSSQGELFSGRLQSRYPIPRKSGEDPIYKRVEDITPDEIAWNRDRFNKTGAAHIAHGDALEALRISRLATIESNAATAA